MTPSPSRPPATASAKISSPPEHGEHAKIDEVDVIGIDEVQFFDAAIIPLTLELVHLGKRVLLAGLDTTFANEPFGPVPALMALADEVTKLSAVCMVCGAPAIHTQRLGASQELVVVGAAGLYEARCRTHFHPYLDEHQSEQLELAPIAATPWSCKLCCPISWAATAIFWHNRVTSGHHCCNLPPRALSCSQTGPHPPRIYDRIGER